MTYKKNGLICLFFSLLLLLFFTSFQLGYWKFIDKYFFNFIISFSSTPITSLMIAMTFLGSYIAVIIICAIQLIWDYKKGITLSLFMVIAYIVANVLKVFIQRPRPTFTHLVVETGYSMPSMHALIAMALFGFLIVVSFKKHKILSFLYIILIVFIGLTRIYLGVHYVSDVIAGYSISLVLLSLFFLLNQKYQWITL